MEFSGISKLKIDLLQKIHKVGAELNENPNDSKLITSFIDLAQKAKNLNISDEAISHAYMAGNNLELKVAK